MAKFVFYASTGYVGADVKETVEIPDDYLEGRSEEKRNEIIQEEFNSWLANNVELSWWEADEEDEEKED